jgi:hypothetical protein
MKKILRGILRDFVVTAGFFTLLKASDILVSFYWGNDVRLFADETQRGVKLQWFFDGSEAASIVGFTIVSLLRMFGIIKDDDEK